MKAGDRVLTYIVERELGEGGMGTVYLGRHTVLNQQVAIKSLSPLLARDQALRERFIQEANIQAGLRHPGIVQVLTADMESDQPSLVMEYIEGKSLSEVLELRGALPVEDALKIMAQVFSAVGYAHQQGVVHRDLKPSNVMVMANGEAKVTDFGIAKVLGSTKLTRTGTAMGSAHYMSPEQIRRPETVDTRSDIYSLGCVFYEVLTARPPFGEKDASGTESDFEIKEGHVRGQIPALQSLRSDIPDGLARLVMQLLEKDPDQRPASCEAVLQHIKAVAEPMPAKPADKTVLVAPEPVSPPMSEPISASVSEPATSSVPDSEKNDKKGMSKNLIIGGAILIAIKAFYIFTSDKKEESAPGPVVTSNQNISHDVDDPNKAWTVAELSARGEKVYAANCVACHQASGEGVPGAFPALDGSQIVNGPQDSQIAILLNGKNSMPGWKSTLSDTEIAAVITYTRNNWSNKAEDNIVQPAEVRAARK